MISAFTPVLVAVFGGWQVYQTDNIKNNLLETVEENKRRHEFAKGVFDNSDVISEGGPRAKIALVGLHAMAVKPRDRVIVLQIASMCERPELFDVSIQLVGSDLEYLKSYNSLLNSTKTELDYEYLNIMQKLIIIHLCTS